MFEYQGKTAFITGASSGIGAEFARELASRGMTLIFAARATESLERLAGDLTAKHNVAVHVLTLDLCKLDAAATAKTFVAERGLTVDLLINNAGFMTFGLCESLDPAAEQNEIQVNCAAVVGLSHVFLPGMLKRRFGGIINVASLAGFQPVPYMAVYAATKAFVIAYSVAMREECRERNVRILALCPGTTSTELFQRAQAEHAAAGAPRTVAQVVATGLSGLDNGKSLVVDGWKNRMMSLGPRLVPKWYAARCAGKLIKPYDERKQAPHE